GALFSNGVDKSALRNRQAGDDLLLEVAWVVVSSVVGADGRGEVLGSGCDVAEVVADEALEPADPSRLHRVELRVPRVEADPNVVADRDQVPPVCLQAGVDAVVRG